MTNKTPAALAQDIGQRLKQARLNRDFTQQDVASLAAKIFSHRCRANF